MRCSSPFSYLLLLLAVSCSNQCHGFVVVTPSTTTSAGQSNVAALIRPIDSSSSQLFSSPNNDNEKPSYDKSAIDGTGGRGAILFGLVFALNVWLFSLPPSFRRVETCSPDFYENVVLPAKAAGIDNAPDCITLDMWIDSIKEYYQNGGGVVFDFSIDPKTVERNKLIWESTFGGGGSGPF